MTKLDTTRAYSTIFNDDHGRSFEQDGHYFTAGGALWHDPAAAAPVKAAPAKPHKAGKPAAPAAPVDDQLTAQMGGAA